MRARGGLAPSFSCVLLSGPVRLSSVGVREARAGEHGGVEAHDDVCGVFTSAYVCCVGSVRPIILFDKLSLSGSARASRSPPHTKRGGTCKRNGCAGMAPAARLGRLGARCSAMTKATTQLTVRAEGRSPRRAALRLPAHCGGVPCVGGCQRRACEAHQAAEAVESRRVLRIERRRGQRGRRAVS